MAKPEFIIEHAMKSQQWERAKGELRALVALQGSYTDPIPDQMKKETPRYKRLGDRVEDFIKSIEDEALQE